MTTSALSIKNLSKNFGHVSVIKDISFDLKSGERHAIIGPNGAGKSTLFNLISGQLKATSGNIYFKNSDISNLRIFEISRLGLSRSFQTSSLFKEMTVFDNLRASYLWSLGYGYSILKHTNRLNDVSLQVEKLMNLLGLSNDKLSIAGELTYANQRILELGIAFATGAEVILLDEPTAGMSQSESSKMVDLIRKLSIDKTLLIIEHDMDVVFNLADQITVLHQGQILATDTPENIRNNTLVRQIYLG